MILETLTTILLSIAPQAAHSQPNVVPTTKRKAT